MVYTPPYEMGCLRPCPLVYNTVRDIGLRTYTCCRAPTPFPKRSVLLAAPRPVELLGSRVGKAHPEPEHRRPLLFSPLNGQETTAMQVVHPVCCGIDVHQAQLTACLRQVDGAGHVCDFSWHMAEFFSHMLAVPLRLSLR
jgi:hypothetical protein